MSEATTTRRVRVRHSMGTISSPGGATAAAAAPAGAVQQLREPLPPADERGKMTIAAIKKWFTSNELMDHEFEALFKDVRSSKAKWLDYMNRRAAALGL